MPIVLSHLFSQIKKDPDERKEGDVIKNQYYKVFDKVSLT